MVGGPFCGRWVLSEGLPDDRALFVTPGQLAEVNPLMKDVGACEYFVETDEADAEQRASFVRECAAA